MGPNSGAVFEPNKDLEKKDLIEKDLIIDLIIIRSRKE